MPVKPRFAAVAVSALLLSTQHSAHATSAPPDGSRYVDPVSGRLGVVSTEDARATSSALDVLKAGGNAADAAIAAVFTIGVTKPESCGVGGGGFLLSRTADGQVAALDFRETAPSSPLYTPRRSMQLPGGHGGSRPETGRGVVGVPGTVDGMGRAFSRLGSGRVSWASLLADAATHARHGFEAQASTVSAIDRRPVDLALFPESNRLLLSPREHGRLTGKVTFAFPEYASVLDTVAKDGPRSFYEGWIGSRLAAEMAGVSGYESFGDQSEMSLSDIREYTARWRTPVSTSYRGYKVYGVPAPAAGPTAVIETLNVLEGFNLAELGRGSVDYLHLVAEAKKLGSADLNAYGGDPDKVDVPELTLTSKPYAAHRRQLISMTEAQSYPHGELEVTPGTVDGSTPGGAQTTSLSVVDKDGNAVVVTCSIERALGSAYVPEGLGFLLNGELFDFNDTDRDKGAANAPAPGKRPRSNQSPMILAKAGVPALVTGGQGGTSIPGGVLASILHTVDFDLNVGRALDAPRVDALVSAVDPAVGTRLVIEDARFPADVLEQLKLRNHTLVSRGEYGHSAVVSAVAVDPATGLRFAAGDPRASAAAPAAQTR
jgi:gamma-glutamyltranspeptidase/glutathione hydrolase